MSKTEVHRRARDVRVICAVHLELIIEANLQIFASAKIYSLKLAGMCRENISLMLKQLFHHKFQLIKAIFESNQ